MHRVNVRERVVNIRNHVENYGDPCVLQVKPDEAAVCRTCGSFLAAGKWHLREQAGTDLRRAQRIVETVCPACQKVRDHDPGGIVSLGGGFVKSHRVEIMNLVNHENRLAIQNNPLERIIDIESSAEGLTIYTTNEKLARKIGRSVHKAYSGNVVYKWSDDARLVRVNWHRE